MKTKTPQNNVRIMKNTIQCRNKNKNTTKQGICFHSCIVLFFSLFLHCFVVFLFLFLHCAVVFFITLSLFCGVFGFIPALCCVFHYSYIVLWWFCFHSYIVLFFLLKMKTKTPQNNEKIIKNTTQCRNEKHNTI
jgi:hypothetical protein